MLLAMDVESAETLAFYLKQGIATRSRYTVLCLSHHRVEVPYREWRVQ